MRYYKSNIFVDRSFLLATNIFTGARLKSSVKLHHAIMSAFLVPFNRSR